MYPLAPVVPLSTTLVRTGFPIAALLIVATICLVAGLLLLRGAALARVEPRVLT